jgi:protein-S-isoprenylcysteine O-methyltransferase Ste14
VTSGHAFTNVDGLLVLLGWMAIGAILLTRPRGEPGPEKRRDRLSIVGMLTQGLGFGIAWGFRPSLVSRPWTASPAAIARTGAVVLLLAASLWLMRAAVRTLGRQWSLTARVLETHRLVMEGPYRCVRHPIYTAMLGMLLATGVAMTGLVRIAVAVVVYVIGTRLRTGVEEKLLRESFGAGYDAYARRVGALIPRLSSGWR